MKNKQTFLNFSRNFNIIGDEEENNKAEALDDTSKDSFIGASIPKRLDKGKKSNVKKSSASKNPYLKKAEVENKLIKITQPRLLLTGAAAALDVNKQSDQNS